MQVLLSLACWAMSFTITSNICAAAKSGTPGAPDALPFCTPFCRLTLFLQRACLPHKHSSSALHLSAAHAPCNQKALAPGLECFKCRFAWCRNAACFGAAGLMAARVLLPSLVCLCVSEARPFPVPQSFCCVSTSSVYCKLATVVAGAMQQSIFQADGGVRQRLTAALECITSAPR